MTHDAVVPTGHYEVELKYRMAESAQTWERLLALGATTLAELTEKDEYWNHPCRDFRLTDEALRIRQCGRHAWLTYKGPREDQQSKMRREIEVKLTPHDDTGLLWGGLLEALGFRRVRIVEKRRRRGIVTWEQQDVTWSWDTVPPLGEFLELEVLADEHHRWEIRDCLLRLAATLGLKDQETRSYLQLLIEQDQQGRGGD
ncbi:MAG: hypothetical protein KatS3mg114_1047 [Planctomycetaceae bacterium]|nr:MAG: hypothetical protein KatS3mg114_1047 [Planctomycetaceae bacterium]